MKTLLAGAAALCLLTEAAVACTSNVIAGTYEVLVQRTDLYYDMTTYGTCWFEVTRNRPEVVNLRIGCAEGEPQWHGFFGLGEVYSPPNDPSALRPWHRLVKLPDQREGVPSIIRRIDGCRWLLTDRNGVEGIDYNVTFASDGSSLQGITTAYSWLAREDIRFVLTGVRQ